MTGAGDEMADVGRAIERAENRPKRWRPAPRRWTNCRTPACSRDALSDQDQIDRGFDEMASSGEVDAELETPGRDGQRATVSPEAGGDAEEEADLEAELAGNGEGTTEDVETPEVDDSEVEAELQELKDDEQPQSRSQYQPTPSTATTTATPTASITGSLEVGPSRVTSTATRWVPAWMRSPSAVSAVTFTGSACALSTASSDTDMWNPTVWDSPGTETTDECGRRLARKWRPGCQRHLDVTQFPVADVLDGNFEPVVAVDEHRSH